MNKILVKKFDGVDYAIRETPSGFSASCKANGMLLVAEGRTSGRAVRNVRRRRLNVERFSALADQLGIPHPV